MYQFGIIASKYKLLSDYDFAGIIVAYFGALIKLGVTRKKNI